MKRYFVGAFVALAFIFAALPNSAYAAVTLTPATGGSAISADTNTTNGTATWTTLTGPTATEGASRDIPASGTFRLNAPSGFAFNTAATVTATITRLAGTGTCFAFSSTTAVPTSSTITYTVTARDSNGTRCAVTFSNIQVRPTAGTPLATGNMLNDGTNTGFPRTTNNYGTLTEVAGAKNKLTITTQPSSTGTVLTDFSVKPVVAVQDTYGNTVTSDSASTITHSAVLSTQVCGGTAGAGALSSTPASGAAVTSGVMSYSALQYSAAENIKICFASSGITSALSSQVSVSPITTTTSVFSSATSTTYGTSVTFSAYVVPASGAAPTGTVTFKDGATTLGTGTLSGGVATFTTSALSATASPHSITAVYGGDLTHSTSTSSAISQSQATKTLTITGITASNKEYDRTTTATLSGTPGTLVGVVSGDTVSLSGTAVGTFSSATVGTGKTVTVSGLSLTGASAGNYSLTQPTTTSDITAKALTVSGITASNKEYDRTTTATLSGTPGTLVGVISGDTVTAGGTATGVFSSAAVGTGKTVTISGVTLSGADAGNYSVTQPTTTANITAKALTVTGITASNKQYDRTTTATLSGTPGTLVGVISGDTVTAGGTPTGAFSDAAVGTGKTVTISGVTISGADASNYSVTQPTTTANITAKALTVSGITASDKEYDRTTTATLNTGSAALVGVISGDTVSLSTGSAAGAFADKTVGTGKTVTVSGLSISGADAVNYSVTQPTTTANITAKALSVTGITASNKEYDRTTSASLSGTPGTLVGVISGDTVSLSGTAVGTFADKNVGTGKTVTISGQTLSGGDAANYSLTQPTTTADISAKVLTVSGITASTKTYDATTSATLSGTPGTLVGVISGDTVTAGGTVTGTFSDAAVGTGKTVTISGVTLSGADAGNYSVTQPTTTGNITAKALTVTGITAANKEYDGTTAATLSGGTLVGVESGDTVSISARVGSFSDAAVGAGKTVTVSSITLTGVSSANYSVTLPSGVTANITAKALTVTGLTADNKTYDGTTSATLSGGSLVGVVLGDTVSVGSATGTFSDKNVGVGKTVSVASVSLSGAQAGNYSVNLPSDVTATITAKALTVTGITASDKEYDRTTSASISGGSLVGVVLGDTVTIGTASGTFANASVGSGKTVSVSITLSGADAGNYSVTAPSGVTASISAKALTVSGATASDKIYDGTTSASVSGGSLVGVISGDTVTLSGTATGAFADKNVGTGKLVTISGYTLSGADAANYSVTQPTTTANITAKTLTVTGVTASNKEYDRTTTGTLNTGSAALVGTVIGDSVALSVSGATGTFSDATVGTGKTVTVSGLSLSGSDSSNYSLTQPTTTATITAKALTVTGITASNKTYDGTTTATLSGTPGTLVGVISGDTVTAGGTPTGAFSDAAVGTGKTVTISGVTLSGADAGNYSVSQPTTTANISAKALTVTGLTAANKTYDRTVTASLSGGSLVGVESGDTVSIASRSGEFSDAAVGTAKTVTVTSITLAGSSATNYSVSLPTGITANITAKALTVTGLTADNKTYDGTTSATLSGGSLVGVISGDTVTIGSSSGIFADKNVGVAKTVTISSVVLSGADASNYSVTLPSDVTATITAKALTITGITASDKEYDRTTSASISGGTLVGVESGDTVTIGSASGSFANASVGTAKTVTVSVTLSGGDAGNYTVTSPSGITASISAKALTVSGVTASDKIYDGTTSASVSGGSLVGVISGDTVTLSGTATGTFADKNVGTAKLVTVSGYTLSGISAGNYSLTQPTAAADISTKALTVSGITASNKEYDRTTAATLNTASAVLVGVISGDTVSLSTGSAAGAFADKTVGTGKTVTVSGLSISGADSSNYSLTQPAATANITAKALTVTGITAENKEYDGTSTAILSGTPGTLVGVISGDTVSAAGTVSGAFSDASIGTNKLVTISGVTLSGDDAANYSVTQPTTTANITGKSLTVTGITATNKTYDGTTSVTLSGGTLVGVASGDVVSISARVGEFFDKAVGTAKPVTVTSITLAGADAGNYSVVLPTDITANITAKALTVSGLTAEDKIYDRTASASLSGGTLVGVVSGDTVSIDSRTGSFATASVGVNKPVTVSSITLTGADSGNYSISLPTGITASITAKALTVTGISVTSKIYDGTTDATLSGGTLVGVESGDTVTIGSATGEFADKNVGTSKPVSVTAISLSGGDAGNYSVSMPSGVTGTITAKALTVSGMTADDKAYDGTTSVTLSGGSLVGVVSGDTVSINTRVGAFDTPDAGADKSVTVSSVTLTGADAGNYSVTPPAGITASITSRSLTVSGITAASKVYNGTLTTTVSGGTLVGLESGDTVTLDSSAAVGTFANKNVGTGKTVTVSGLVLSGADAASYTLVQPTTTADITAKSLTISGLSVTAKTYDGTTDATLSGTPSLVGTVSGDLVSLSGTASGSFDSSAVGLAKSVAVSGLTLAGGDAANYSLTLPTLSGDIVYATPAISSLNPSSATAGAGDTLLVISGTGFVASSTVAVNGASRSMTLTSSTEISTTLLSSDLATATSSLAITVSNPAPGGGTSSVASFVVGVANNPVPVLTSATSTTKIAGDAGYTLSLSGSNFVSSSVVRINGQDRTTTFVSSSELTAFIPSTDLATATSTARITVFNPTPGGGTSSALTLTVLAAPDSQKPVIASFTVNSSSSYLEIPITAFTATDNTGVTGYLITTSSSTPSLSDSGWTASAPTEFSVSVQGEYTLFAWAKDAAGNISNAASAAVTVSFLEVSPSQVDTLFTSGAMTAAGGNQNAATQVSVNQTAQIAFTGGTRIIIPVGTTMTTATTADFSQVSVAAASVDVSALPSGYTSVGAASYGLPTQAISLSQPATIQIFVGTSRNGQSLSVWKKESGSTDWQDFTTCTIASGFCEFTTSSFSSFVVTTFSAPVSAARIQGGVVPPSQITFSGIAYPGGTVVTVSNGPDGASTLSRAKIASSSGAFKVNITGVFQRKYTYGFYVEDQNGNTTPVKTFTVDFSSDSIILKDIFAAPTASVPIETIAKGNPVRVSGYASPKARVKVTLDGGVTYEVNAAADGSYKIDLRSDGLRVGQHTLVVRQTDPITKAESGASLQKIFRIGTVQTYSKFDLSKDGVTDLTDWSIFISRYSSTDVSVKSTVDFNGDGKVDSKDVSLFLPQLKK